MCYVSCDWFNQEKGRMCGKETKRKTLIQISSSRLEKLKVVTNEAGARMKAEFFKPEFQVSIQHPKPSAGFRRD